MSVTSLSVAGIQLLSKKISDGDLGQKGKKTQTQPFLVGIVPALPQPSVTWTAKGLL